MGKPLIFLLCLLAYVESREYRAEVWQVNVYDKNTIKLLSVSHGQEGWYSYATHYFEWSEPLFDPAENQIVDFMWGTDVMRYANDIKICDYNSSALEGDLVMLTYLSMGISKTPLCPVPPRKYKIDSPFIFNADHMEEMFQGTDGKFQSGILIGAEVKNKLIMYIKITKPELYGKRK